MPGWELTGEHYYDGISIHPMEVSFCHWVPCNRQIVQLLHVKPRQCTCTVPANEDDLHMDSSRPSGILLRRGFPSRKVLDF